MRITDHPLYDTWESMKKRCNNSNHKSYERYGAKGVTVSPEWSASFEAFANDMGPKPDPSFTLDRINPNGNYEKENCRWASRQLQSRNWRTRNRRITHNGETRCLAEWCEKTGLSRDLIRVRLDRLGWSIADALTTPKTHKHLRGKLMP